jgi:hypothetical protein
VTKLQTPVIGSITNITDANNKVTSVQLSWGTVTGANGYTVIDRYNNGSTTTTLSYTVSGQQSSGLVITEAMTGIGSHSFTVQAIASSNSAYTSDESSSKTFTVVYLENPILTWTTSGKSYVSASAKDNANTYILSLVNSKGVAYSTSEIAITQLNGYNVHSLIYSNGLSLTPDTYTVNAYSRSTNDFYYRQSSTTASNLQYQIIRLDAPQSLYFNADTEDISWSAVQNAIGYVLYDQEKAGTTVRYPSTGSMTATTYDFEGLSGLHYYHVNAIAASDTDVNPKFLDSYDSAVITGGGLLTPVVTRTGSIISWPQIDNAISYVLYDQSYSSGTTPIANISVSSESTQQYDLSTNTISDGLGNHIITVVASGSDDEFALKSKPSNQISYTITQLIAPAITFNPTGTSTVVWSAVNNASFYDIYVNNELETTLASDVLTYSLKKEVPGSYVITVVARNSDTFLFVASAKSNQLIATVSKLGNPQLVFTYSEDQTSGTVSWVAIPNANSYRITIIQNGVA